MTFKIEDIIPGDIVVIYDNGFRHKEVKEIVVEKSKTSNTMLQKIVTTTGEKLVIGEVKQLQHYVEIDGKKKLVHKIIGG